MKYFMIFLPYIFPWFISGQCPEMVWNDEFNTNTITETKWQIVTGDGCDIGNCGWGNNELQYFSAENIHTINGILNIVAKKESMVSSFYTSGKFFTKEKINMFSDGRIEIFMKMPKGRGLQSVIQLLPDPNNNGWIQNKGIDIVNFLGDEVSTLLSGIHVGNEWPDNYYHGRSFTINNKALSDDFHLYVLEWDNEELRWFIDGYLYYRLSKSHIGLFPWPFDQPLHLAIQLSVGGTYAGNPNLATVFPSQLEVEYIRTYNRAGFPYLTGETNVVYKSKEVRYQAISTSPSSSFEWKVPEGVEIKNGENSNVINTDWAFDSGDVVVDITDECRTYTCKLAVKTQPGISRQLSLENFDDEALITKDYTTGQLNDVAVNPLKNEVNDSDLCGHYLRNVSQQYDVLFYKIDEIKDASQFTSSRKKFFLDVLTDAPIGSQIILQLENGHLATPANYPLARHSRYETYTTISGSWERLQFSYIDAPDASTAPDSVDQLVFLFASNTFSGHNYYFDNFDIYEEILSGISTPIVSNDIQVYPNPVHDDIFFSNEEEIISIRIFDLSGKVVGVTAYMKYGISTLSASLLPNGIYIAEILKTDGTIERKKIIVSH